MLQTMPVTKPESTISWEKYEGPRTNQPTKVHIIQTCLTRDFSTLTFEIYHGSSRPDPHETRTSRVPRSVPGRVGSGQQAFKILQVSSGRVRMFSKPHGSGRVGSRGFTRRTDHELAHLSCIAQVTKTCADELRPTAQAGENMCSSCSSIAHPGSNELSHVAPIAHPGQICADELSSIA